MGCVFSDTKEEAHILMIGLDGAGKTTIFKQLNKEDGGNTLPTLGFNVNKVQFQGLTMTLWDIGGQRALRSFWSHYYKTVQAVVFVVDSGDEDRLRGKSNSDKDSAAWWIKELANIDELDNDCLFLILANKQDQVKSGRALSTSQIIDALDLCGQFRGRKWHVQPTIAITNDGIVEAFQWLKVTLKKLHDK